MPESPYESILDAREFVTFVWELPDDWHPNWVCEVPLPNTIWGEWRPYMGGQIRFGLALKKVEKLSTETTIVMDRLTYYQTRGVYSDVE